MLAYDIQSDLSDQKQFNLKLLLYGTIAVGIFIPLLAATLQMQFSAAETLPWLLLYVLVALAYLTERINHRKAAARIYIFGLVAVLALAMFAHSPAPIYYFLLLVPIALTALLLGAESVIQVMVLSAVVAVVSAMVQVGFGPAISISLLPILMYAVVGLVIFLNTRNMLETVYWTVDVHQKGMRRAEMYYEQKEQLAEALRELTHTKAGLELANVKLAEAQRKTEEASRAKSVFMSNMSHELRTPLNVVIGYSSSMLEMPQMFDNVPLPDVYQPYMQLIQENGQYLVGLINDILDLSKIEAGKLELHPSAVNLSDIFRGVLATSIGLLKNKPVQIRSDFPDNLPIVWADPMRVRQILLNLLSNAIKFTHTGSVTLAAQLDKDGKRIHISIIDTGIGIPEEAQATIFDRFQQAQHDTDKHYGGTGLGLDISKQLSVMHGGDLTLHSVLGEGSTFTFSLPVAAPEQQTLLQPLPSTASASANTVFDREEIPSVANVHAILVAEGDMNVRTFIRSTLEDARYLVIDTHEAAQLHELAAGLLPSAIVLDASLRSGSLDEILKSLKEDSETAAIPVILCLDEHVAERMSREGNTLVLSKPFTPDALTNVVQKALSTSVVDKVAQ